MRQNARTKNFLNWGRSEQLIFALLKYRTKGEAAAAAGINAATMYRWFRNPKFMAAYRSARREMFDEALAVLQKGARKAAQRLVDETDDETATLQPQNKIKAANRVLAHAFRAHDAILIEEELAELREVIDTLKAGGQELQESPMEVTKDMLSTEEHVEATRIRVSWMNAFGFDPESIQNSLKFTRPQSVAEEQLLFDLVQKQFEADTESSALSKG